MEDIIRYDTLYSRPNDMAILFCGKPESATTLDGILSEFTSLINGMGFVSGQRRFEIHGIIIPFEDITPPIPQELVGNSVLKVYNADLGNITRRDRETTYEMVKTRLDERIRQQMQSIDLENFLPMMICPYSSAREAENALSGKRREIYNEFSGKQERKIEEIKSCLTALVYYASESVPPNMYIYIRIRESRFN